MARAVLYENINFNQNDSGNTREFGNDDPSKRYAIGYNDPTFANFGLRHSRRFDNYASSVKLYNDTGVPMRNTFVAFDKGFWGRAWAYAYYQQYRGIPWFGDWNYNGQYYHINDKASSAIIVKHPNTPVRPLIPISLQGMSPFLTNFMNSTLTSLSAALVAELHWELSDDAGLKTRNEPQRFQFTIDRDPWNGYPLVMWTWPIRLNSGGLVPDDGFEAIYWLSFYVDGGRPRVRVVDSVLANLKPVYRSRFFDFFIGTLPIPVVPIFAAIDAGRVRRLLSDAFLAFRQTLQDAVQTWLGWKFIEAKFNSPQDQLSLIDTYIMPGGVAWDGGTRGGGADPFLVWPNQNNQPKDYFIPDTNYDTTLVWVPVQGS